MSVTKESQSTSMLMWILSIFFGFLPSLIFFIIKKEDAFVRNNAKEALNIIITVVLAFIAIVIVGTILAKIAGALAIVAMLLYLAVYLYWLYCCIMGAIKANKGESFSAPFALKLIK